MTTTIRQLLYSTRATSPITSPELRDIQRKTESEHYTLGVTGFMIYGFGHFVHLIEGTPDVVKEVYERNVRETWHFGASVLYDHESASRCIRSWSVGVLNLECDPSPDWTTDCRQLIDACLDSPKISPEIRLALSENADKIVLPDESAC